VSSKPHLSICIMARIVTGLFMATGNAWGADTPYQVVFSGRFNAPSIMKLVISRAKLNATGSAPANPLHGAKAEIWTTRLEASCSLVSLEKMDDRSTAINFKCRSARLGALTSSVTLFVIPNTRPEANILAASHPRPAVVRFGTWLEGYEQAQVTVDMDRTNSLLSHPNVIATSGADRTKLARR
jgi:hypothetical protein